VTGELQERRGGGKKIKGKILPDWRSKRSGPSAGERLSERETNIGTLERCAEKCNSWKIDFIGVRQI